MFLAHNETCLDSLDKHMSCVHSWAQICPLVTTSLETDVNVGLNRPTGDNEISCGSFIAFLAFIQLVTQCEAISSIKEEFLLIWMAGQLKESPSVVETDLCVW